MISFDNEKRTDREVASAQAGPGVTRTAADPLRPYRFSSVARVIFPAAYGALLGTSVMTGNTTVNFIVIILSVILSYVLVKGLAGRLLVRVKVVSCPSSAVPGSPAAVRVRVKNYSPFAFPVCCINIADPSERGGNRQFFYLPPFGRRETGAVIRYPHCARYRIRISEARLVSAGGLVDTSAFIRRKKLPTVNVVPAPAFIGTLPRPADNIDSPIPSGEVATEPTGSFYLRQYAPGDDPRYIHWKRSASRQDWLIKGFYKDLPGRAVVYMDSFLPGGLVRDLTGEKNPFRLSAEREALFDSADKMCVAAMSVCSALSADGRDVTFVYPDRSGALTSMDIPAGTSTARLSVLLGTVPFPDAENGSGGSDAVQSFEPERWLAEGEAAGSAFVLVYSSSDGGTYGAAETDLSDISGFVSFVTDTGRNTVTAEVEP